MKTAAIRLGLLLVVLSAGQVVANEEPQEQRPHRGVFRIGPFYLTGIKTTLQLNAQNAPLGTHVDFDEDLGLGDSATTPRVMFDYHFNRKHALGLKWYRIERRGQTVLDRTIQFGDKEFVAGTEVDSFIDTDLATLEYVWGFYESEKVALGVSAGLSFTTIHTGIGSVAQGGSDANSAKITVPLPTLGGRLGYRVTPKLSVLARFDLLSLAYGDYEGTVLDAWFAAEHHTFRRVGFGGSLGRMVLDVEADDDDLFWDARYRFNGILGYVAVYF